MTFVDKLYTFVFAFIYPTIIIKVLSSFIN